jgi:hypothetical protein
MKHNNDSYGWYNGNYSLFSTVSQADTQVTFMFGTGKMCHYFFILVYCLCHLMFSVLITKGCSAWPELVSEEREWSLNTAVSIDFCWN